MNKRNCLPCAIWGGADPIDRTSVLGYTLIEILIVLLIISIVTSVALVSVGHNQNRQIDVLAEDIVQKLSLAEEQAMLQPAVLGFFFDGRVFHVVSYEVRETNAEKHRTNWVPFDDPILKPIVIPKNMQVSFLSDEDKLRKQDHREDAEQQAVNPQIIISTNGDISPFTMYIGRKDVKPRYVITSDVNGNINKKMID